MLIEGRERERAMGWSGSSWLEKRSRAALAHEFSAIRSPTD
jgi:hypothetical protein